jgi:hypothetical protein
MQLAASAASLLVHDES